MTSALISSLLSKGALLGGLAGASAAKNSNDIEDEGLKLHDSGVLGDGEEQSKEDKADKEEKIEDVSIKNLSKDDKNELLLELAESGVGSKALNEISKSLTIPGYQLYSLIKGQADILDKLFGKWPELQRLSPKDFDKAKRQVMGSPMLNPEPGDDDDDKKKKEDKKKKVSEKFDELDKKRANNAKGEKDFRANDPKTKAIEQNKAWNKAVEQGKTDIVKRNDPKMQNLHGDERASQLSRLKSDAIKKGMGEQWEFNHVSPTKSIPR